ncbi:MAG TPA: hypothetical protein VMU13_03095 [Candidatus Paceibacterota bacterium]|nr:hypothetical protein [Candidatus Paceibacterota bacterium]
MKTCWRSARALLVSGTLALALAPQKVTADEPVQLPGFVCRTVGAVTSLGNILDAEGEDSPTALDEVNQNLGADTCLVGFFLGHKEKPDATIVIQQRYWDITPVEITSICRLETGECEPTKVDGYMLFLNKDKPT